MQGQVSRPSDDSQLPLSEVHAVVRATLEREAARNPTQSVLNAVESVVCRSLNTRSVQKRMQSPSFSLRGYAESVCRNYLAYRPLVQALCDPDHSRHQEEWSELSAVLTRTIGARFSREMAESCVSSVYVTVVRQMDVQYNYLCKPGTWVIQVAINEARTQARRMSRLVPMEFDDDALPGLLVGHGQSETTPEEFVEAVERRRLLTMLVEKSLRSTNQRKVIELMLSDQDDGQIAALLGMSQGNVRLLRHRALVRLREVAQEMVGSETDCQAPDS
jgi:RNA polymerase sigma factor (sigma-70 family)